MTYTDRPAQITAILDTFGSGDNAEMHAELETYIADLEFKQPNRPARIVAILKTIDAQYPVDMRTALETYIDDLETKQQVASQEDDKTPSYDPENPPIWSHQRAAQRARHHREHALKKQS